MRCETFPCSVFYACEMCAFRLFALLSLFLESIAVTSAHMQPNIFSKYNLLLFLGTLHVKLKML